jgi:hypothetical protein
VRVTKASQGPSRIVLGDLESTRDNHSRPAAYVKGNIFKTRATHGSRQSLVALIVVAPCPLRWCASSEWKRKGPIGLKSDWPFAFTCRGLGLSGPIRVCSAKPRTRNNAIRNDDSNPPAYCAAAAEPGRRKGRRASSSTAAALRFAIATIGWPLSATRSTATDQPL